jgi:hypothetical protein
MKRVYHHHDDREECASDAMWRNVSTRERDAFALVTAELMAFPDQFEAAMLRALDEWPLSCEANLTASAMNQRAWLGHAGCFLATGSPEDATRLGWHHLDSYQQVQANAAADRAIAIWRHRRLWAYPGQEALFEGDHGA